MKKVVWSEKYSVGVKDLDEQHKIIFDLINTFIETKNITVRSEKLTAALSKMTDYFWDHFKIEEKYMKEYNYPEYEEHFKRHVQFKKKTMDLCVDTMAHKDSVPNDLLIFLNEWWSKHILNEDMRYRSFFNELGLR